jgi:hypothetical protein
LARSLTLAGAALAGHEHPRCNMLWIGPRLGRIERACMLSVLRQGHPLTLWCYQPPDGLPAGVDLAPATEIFPEHSIIRYQGGSVALFANRFRYELQRLGKGIWLDTDIYLVKPIAASDYLMTLEAPGRINNAPLRLPAGSPLLPPLLQLFEEGIVPSWLPLRARLAAHWRRLRHGRAELASMPWGVAGPSAITALAKRFGLVHLASPVQAFHPYHWTEADWIRDPARQLDHRATDATLGVHLWNECIKTWKEDEAPAGSFLARLHDEGAF